MSTLSFNKPAQRLRIYISEGDRWRGKALYSAILEVLREKGLAGATVLRGAAGFGAGSRIRTTGIEALAQDLPLVIEVIDEPEKLSPVIDVVYTMVHEGLITLEEVKILKYTHRSLNPLPADRLVGEVMTREVISLPADTPVAEVWEKMLQREVKAIPIVDRDRRVVGILTDEDLMERAGVRQRLSVALRLEKDEVEEEIRQMEQADLRVEKIMTHPVICVQKNDSLGLATAQMIQSGLKRMPVVDEDGKLVGMLSRLDILRQIAGSHEPLPSAAALLPGARTLEDVMTRDIPMVYQDDNLSALIEKFAHSQSHRLIVVDGEGKAIGLVSDSDVVTRAQPAKRSGILDALRRIGKPPAGKENAFDLMSPGVLTAPPEMSIVEGTQAMLVAGRKWLVVVDTGGRPLGLVDRQILLESLIHTPEGTNP